MKLQPSSEHPHGLSDHDFDALFTTDKPIIFAFHGYPSLIHRLTYRRSGHENIHVRGYKEEGTTTTPFDMCVLNDLDRFHLVSDVIDRVPKLGARAAYAKQAIRDKLIDHRQFIARYGDDMPEVTGWRWGQEGSRRICAEVTDEIIDFWIWCFRNRKFSPSFRAEMADKPRDASAAIEPRFMLVFIDQSNEGRSRQCPLPNGIIEKQKNMLRSLKQSL
jgi:XFP C-terminal domain